MRDWRSMARVSGIPLSQQELERVVGPLDDLEVTFRQLARDLSPDLEPATAFHLEDQSE